jgi:hypothetical protein
MFLRRGRLSGKSGKRESMRRPGSPDPTMAFADRNSRRNKPLNRRDCAKKKDNLHDPFSSFAVVRCRSGFPGRLEPRAVRLFLSLVRRVRRSQRGAVLLLHEPATVSDDAERNRRHVHPKSLLSRRPRRRPPIAFLLSSGRSVSAAGRISAFHPTQGNHGGARFTGVYSVEGLPYLSGLPGMGWA